jgi:peptide/nickel transport system ATP-binding protein
MTPLVKAEGLVKRFVARRSIFGKPLAHVNAVDGVSFTVEAGKTLALVGESGSGKSTVGRLVLRLIEPTAGRVRFDGQDVFALKESATRGYRRQAQLVFQDPYASLNPRQTVRRTLADPLRLHGVGNRGEIEDRVADMLKRVGLTADQADRYPHEFSGGQRQRIGIARALILRPKLVICDEPVSALDVSIRAQIINLLLELKESLGLSYLMISHDLGVVEHMSDRVAVMYLGKIVETGDWRSIFEHPTHPYTRGLIAAIPDPFAPAGAAADKVKGEIPSPFAPPGGCAFHPRCPVVVDRCRAAPGPELAAIADTHAVSCWRASSTA